jgi:hypothetical protein
MVITGGVLLLMLAVSTRDAGPPASAVAGNPYPQAAEARFTTICLGHGSAGLCSCMLRSMEHRYSYQYFQGLVAVDNQRATEYATVGQDCAAVAAR